MNGLFFRRIVTGISFSLCSLLLFSQTVRQVNLSNHESFTDNIALAADSKDMDVMVKLQFDESHNQLVVSLLSYRLLLVFHEDVRYGSVVKHRCLRPERLPYVVTTDPMLRIHFDRSFRRQMDRPHRKQILSRWASYEGLQPVPQAHQIVNDFIEQRFDVIGQETTDVTFSLRDVCVMNRDERNKSRYNLVHRHNINIDYRIRLHRDPCRGRESEIEMARSFLESIRSGIHVFRQRFPSNHVQTEEQAIEFRQMKDVLINQFARHDSFSTCPEVQQLWDSYNTSVDSIASFICHLQEQYQHSAKGVDVELLYSKARQIDYLVTRWLNSNDAVEQRDIHLRCLSLAKSVKDLVATEGLVSEEQRKAYQVFTQAIQYARTSIHLSKERKKKP